MNNLRLVKAIGGRQILPNYQACFTWLQARIDGFNAGPFCLSRLLEPPWERQADTQVIHDGFATGSNRAHKIYG